MKKIKVGGIIVLVCAIGVLSGCGSSNTVSLEDGQDKIMELNDKVISGEITAEMAEVEMAKIKGEMETFDESLKNNNDNIGDFKGIPVWAIAAGVTEPKGLKVIQSESSIIKDDGSVMPDSFEVLYSGDHSIVMSEAKKIAGELKLTPMIDSAESFIADGNIDGEGFSVMIVADDKGLFLNVVDLKKLNEYNTIKK